MRQSSQRSSAGGRGTATRTAGRGTLRARAASLAAVLSAATLLALPGSVSGASHAARPASSGPTSHLHLVDYFPASNGWGSMWWNWNPGQIQADFSRIASLHANAVRVIVSARAFGYPSVNPLMASRLSATISLAAESGLRVELTLFDEWHNFGAVAQSEAWARELLTPLRADPRIAYIDLHNEIPADTNPVSLAWAQAMVPFTKLVDGGIPVTVSTSISSGVAPLEALARGLSATPPDLYDVHYYGNPADAYPVLAQAQRAAGSVPLFVGETGFATDRTYGWARGLAPDPASLDAYQSYYYRDVEHAALSLGLAPAAPWILYDMPGQGGTTWGEHMGILSSDGVPKPAALTLASIFSTETSTADFNNGFEQVSGARPMPMIWRPWMPGAARFAADRSVSHSGSWSARISRAAGSHLSGCPAFYVAPIAAINPASTYTAGAWVRGQSAAGLTRVVLVWSDSAGHFIGSTASVPMSPGTSGWQHLVVGTRPPALASAVEIDLQVCENPGTSWFDDVTFAPAG